MTARVRVDTQLRGDCRCRQYSGDGRVLGHLYGVAGCAYEAAAAAELAEHDHTLPDGYWPGAFTRS